MEHLHHRQVLQIRHQAVDERQEVQVVPHAAFVVVLIMKAHVLVLL